jgi:predicted ATPase
MLHTVAISDFKRISAAGITLRKLGAVNYLVGENGSGKSSILQAIYGFLQQPQFPGLDLDISPLSIIINGKRTQTSYEAIYVNQDVRSLLRYYKSCSSILTDLQDELLDKYNYLEWGLYTSFFQEDKRLQYKTKLVYEEYFEKILKAKAKNKFIIFLIEEPENYLHPTWEKSLAYIYKRLTDKYPCQFLVATHSPFVISAAGDITDTEKTNKNNNNLFKPSQKVYLIKDGVTASKSGRTGWIVDRKYQVGSDGYWGKKITYLGAKLLGAGMQDFISPVHPHYTKEAPSLIFCEGEGKNEDATIYNQIFADLEPRVLFVSSRGLSETTWSFQLLEEVKNGLSGNFHTLMLRDRDHEFPSKKDIQKFKAANPSVKILQRRALENYIFNQEILEKWVFLNDLRLPKHLLREVILTDKIIARQVSRGLKGASYKKVLNQIFGRIWRWYMQEVKGHTNPDSKAGSRAIPQEFKHMLVSMVTPETKTYKELYGCIFQ